MGASQGFNFKELNVLSYFYTSFSLLDCSMCQYSVSVVKYNIIQVHNFTALCILESCHRHRLIVRGTLHVRDITYLGCELSQGSFYTYHSLLSLHRYPVFVHCHLSNYMKNIFTKILSP